MNSFGPEDLLACYRRGVFPMSDDRNDEGIFLVEPTERGIVPLDSLHISRTMQKVMNRGDFDVTYNHDFAQVIALCAESAPDRKTTWINHGIEYLYKRLHAMNHAHSVEVWRDGEIIGALYGVSIGGAFFGESMVSRAVNGSKIALIKLVERLNSCGYVLLDTQFLTDHLASMGAVEITKQDYQKRLKAALKIEASFR
jgi:leucyl/phenylalanyl-tRNA--protein transferase